jgi:hypothetical protein
MEIKRHCKQCDCKTIQDSTSIIDTNGEFKNVYICKNCDNVSNRYRRESKKKKVLDLLFYELLKA